MSNSTLDPSDYCTIGTCPLSEANFTYIPSLAGNLVYLIIFAVIIIPQVWLGLKYRTWTYTIPIFCGLILDIIGYAGRVQLHFNPFPFDPFLEYLICLTIAPAFLTAAIYLCLGRLVQIYGVAISRIPPKWYTYIFVTSDFVSLVLQAAGGAITATADDKSTSDVGVNIMIAGLAFQVASLVIFAALCLDYALRLRKRWNERNTLTEDVYATKWCRLFIAGLALASLTIFIRCVFRVAELSDGFNGSLFNDQTAFMVLEGPMIIIASLALTMVHPGFVFGRSWSVKKVVALSEGRLTHSRDNSGEPGFPLKTGGKIQQDSTHSSQSGSETPIRG